MPGTALSRHFAGYTSGCIQSSKHEALAHSSPAKKAPDFLHHLLDMPALLRSPREAFDGIHPLCPPPLLAREHPRSCTRMIDGSYGHLVKLLGLVVCRSLDRGSCYMPQARFDLG